MVTNNTTFTWSWPDIGYWPFTYEIEVYNDAGYTSLNVKSSVSEPTFTGGSFEYGETYYWRVRVSDKYGNKSGWAANSFTMANGAVTSDWSCVLPINVTCHKLITDNESVYVCGRFWGTVDFNPNGTPLSKTAVSMAYDGFVAKYDNAGICQWVYTIADKDVLGAACGDSCVCAYAVPWTFDSFSALKVNAHDGVEIWNKTVTAVITGYGDVAVSEYGDSYFAGAFSGTTNFNVSGGSDIKSSTNKATFILKTTNDGNYCWTNVADSSSGDMQGPINIAASMTPLDGCNRTECVYLASEWTGNVWLDPTHQLGDIGVTTNVFVARYNSDGNFSGYYGWVHPPVPGLGPVTFSGMCIGFDKTGVQRVPRIYITGLHYITHNPWLHESPGCYLAQFDNACIRRPIGAKWSYISMAAPVPISSALTVDPTGSVYQGGSFSGTAVFNDIDSHTAVSSNDLYIEKFDYNSTILYNWIEIDSSHDENACKCLIMSRDGGLYSWNEYVSPNERRLIRYKYI